MTCPMCNVQPERVFGLVRHLNEYHQYTADEAINLTNLLCLGDNVALGDAQDIDTDTDDAIGEVEGEA